MGNIKWIKIKRDMVGSISGYEEQKQTMYKQAAQHQFALVYYQDTNKIRLIRNATPYRLFNICFEYADITHYALIDTPLAMGMLEK